MNIYSIYKATNKINGKCYIGFDSNWPNRKSYHKSFYKKQNYKFYLAIRKHGFDNFQWELLYQSKDVEHTLNVMENYFIIEYDSYNKGYNSTLGGDGVLGIVAWNKGKTGIYSKEVISSISKSAKGNKKRLGKKFTDESKQKMSLAALARDYSYLHKKVSTPDGQFNSLTEAAKHYKKSRAWVTKQIKNNTFAIL
jgi:group I intron endonuclease